MPTAYFFSNPLNPLDYDSAYPKTLNPSLAQYQEIQERSRAFDARVGRENRGHKFTLTEFARPGPGQN
jgi:hypothetical protein